MSNQPQPATTRLNLKQRSAGVLLHLTSLPGPHGSGDLGPEALRFADFLKAAGQRWWQMLPVGPIGPGNSPYASTSAFAGNPLLVNLEGLAAQGMLAPSDLRQPHGLSHARVSFTRVIAHRSAKLRQAFAVAMTRPRSWRDALVAFRESNRHWLDDFAVFSALSARHRGRPWHTWGAALVRRRPSALAEAQAALADEIAFEEFTQYQFDRQWRRFKRECNARGIALIGDVPIFVTHDSSDVWAHPDLFQLGADGRPRSVSGCPPDFFSKTGQLWGHPHYAWERHEATGFRWWIARLRRAIDMFDAVRIDHFIGFYRAWQVPGRAKTAAGGRYALTPGRQLLEAATRVLGTLPIIAEDLGAVTPEVWELRDHFGYPGMRVLQFAFRNGESDRYDQPHNHVRNAVVYTGTHDTNTTPGWFASLRGRGSSPAHRREAARALAYAGGRPASIHWDMIRLAYQSVANLAIIPMQDFLGLGVQARMNRPATATGNWGWRMRQPAATARLAERIRDLCETFAR